MANWIILKAAIEDVIKTNGNQEITGQVLQNVLNNIITNVGENATFAGIATPDNMVSPGFPDGPVFYFAASPGVYSNFDGIKVLDGEAAILLWENGVWKKLVTGFATQEQLSKYKGTVTGVKINGSIKTPNSSGIVDLGTIEGGTGGGGGEVSVEGFIPLSRDFNDDFNDDFAR